MVYLCFEALDQQSMVLVEWRFQVGGSHWWAPGMLLTVQTTGSLNCSAWMDNSAIWNQIDSEVNVKYGKIYQLAAFNVMPKGEMVGEALIRIDFCPGN